MKGRAGDERGAALLTVLLLVAVMAVIAATALDRLLLATRVAGGAMAVDQGRAFTLAAEQLALRRVGELVRRDPNRMSLTGDWLERDIPLPLPAGQGIIRLSDASNCFNLNSLVAETTPGVFSQRTGAVAQFGELMTIVGIDPGESAAIAGAAADWIDSDGVDGPLGAEDGVYRGLAGGYLPANRLMADESELRAVRGVTAKNYARLRSWVCALPTTEPVRLNVNTLRPDQAPLIAMLMPGQIRAADARAALAARPQGGYGSSVRFWQSGPLAQISPSSDVGEQAGVTSRWLVLNVRVDLGDGQVTGRSLIDAYGGGLTAGTAPPAIVRRSWSDEN